MVTERQIVAILGVIASATALAFAVYAVYKAFNPNQVMKT